MIGVTAMIVGTLLQVGASAGAGAPAPKSGPTAEQLVDQGIHLHDAGRHADAVAAYDAALALHPGDPTATYERAYTLSDMGRHEEAVAACREFLAVQRPTHPAFHVVLGSSLDVLGRLPEGEKAFRQGLKRFPGDGKLLFNLGVNQVAQGHLDDAEKTLQASLRARPLHPGTWRQLAVLSAARKRPLASYVALARSFTLSPPGDARTTLAKALAELPFRDVHRAPDAADGTPGDTTITLAPGADEAEGREAMVLSVVAAGFMNGSENVPSRVAVHASILTIARELGEHHRQPAWQSEALAFFARADAEGHGETIARTILAEAGYPESATWVADHPRLVAAADRFARGGAGGAP